MVYWQEARWKCQNRSLEACQEEQQLNHVESIHPLIVQSYQKKEVKNTDIFYCTADCLCFLVPVNKIEGRMSQENIMNL
jgi:hypothetical protein